MEYMFRRRKQLPQQLYMISARENSLQQAIIMTNALPLLAYEESSGPT